MKLLLDENLPPQLKIPVRLINALFITYPGIKPLIPKIRKALNTSLKAGTTIIAAK